jgi:hypothetical protein
MRRTVFTRADNKLLLLMVLFTFTLKSQITFQQIYPCNIDQSSRDVISTSDGGYLIAGMTETAVLGDTNILMVKTDQLGDTMWTKVFGTTGINYPNSIVETSDGNYFIAGYTNSYGAGSYDAWLIKMSPSGSLLWWNTYGGTGIDDAREIIATSDGNYVIVGRHSNGSQYYDVWLMKIDIFGNVIWEKNYGGAQYETGRSVKQSPDGGYIVTGQTKSYGNGGGDIYLIKTDSNGDTLWTKTYGGPNEDDGNWVVANSDGTIVLTAETNSYGAGAMDVQAMKVDAMGAVVWSKIYGGNDKDVSKTIYGTSDGGYIIGAISRSFGWVDPDMWLLKLDAMGDTTWTRHYGSWDHEHCHHARQTADGGYIAVGHTKSYGPTARIMFLKLNPNGLPGPTSIEEQNENFVSVSPNPSSGIIRVSLKAIENWSYKITNALGKVLSAGSVAQQKENESKIDLSMEPPGMYILSVQYGDKITTRKIILN